MLGNLREAPGILWRLAVAPWVRGWVGVVGSGMTGRVSARFNSARVRLLGVSHQFSNDFQNHFVVEFSYNLFVALVMKVSGFMLI